MERMIGIVVKLSRVTNIVGGVILVLMMLLTVLDVILRYLGKPITGTYELMGFAGALVIGFAIAQTSLDGAHVGVDMLTDRLGPLLRNLFLVMTKLLAFALFVLVGWALFVKGHDLYKTGEVSLTLRVPYFPVAYGLCLCAFMEALVLLTDILRALSGRGGNHE